MAQEYHQNTQQQQQHNNNNEGLGDSIDLWDELSHQQSREIEQHQHQHQYRTTSPPPNSSITTTTTANNTNGYHHNYSPSTPNSTPTTPTTITTTNGGGTGIRQAMQQTAAVFTSAVVGAKDNVATAAVAMRDGFTSKDTGTTAMMGNGDGRLGFGLGFGLTGNGGGGYMRHDSNGSSLCDDYNGPYSNPHQNRQYQEDEDRMGRRGGGGIDQSSIGLPLAEFGLHHSSSSGSIMTMNRNRNTNGHHHAPVYNNEGMEASLLDCDEFNNTNNRGGNNNDESTTTARGGGGGNIQNVKDFILLNQFRLRPKRDGWGMVANLDLYFTSLYNYYYHQGLAPIIGKGIVELITLFFTLVFSVFLIAYLNWSELLNCKDEESCGATLQEYIIDRPFHQASFWNFTIIIYILLFSAYGIFSTISFVSTVRGAFESKYIFEDKLGISARKLEGGAVEWHEVVQKILNLQRDKSYRVAQNGQDIKDELVIAQRIMRRENFMIAFFNRNMLDLTISSTSFFGFCSGKMFYSKSLEWSIYVSVFSYMFNHKYHVRPAFYTDPASLRRRFIVCGIAHAIFMPFLLSFMTLHFFMQNVYDFRSSEQYLGPRDWSNVAKWKFREFNELPHVFERRLGPSYEAAEEYVHLFSPSSLMSSIGRVLVFLSGSIVAVLLMLAGINDAILLHVKLGNWNLLWYVGVLGLTFSIGKGMLPDSNFIPRYHHNLDAEMDSALAKVSSHTHHYPEFWKKRGWDNLIKLAFSELYQYKAKLFFMEIASVIVAPVVLCFSLPNCAVDICSFVQKIKAEVPGTGDHCGYSTFDFDLCKDESWEGQKIGVGKHPTQGGTTPWTNSTKSAGDAVSQSSLRPKARLGKMEKSFFNFKTVHPEWICSSSGQDLLDRMETYQNQQAIALARERHHYVEAATRQLETLHKMEENTNANLDNQTPHIQPIEKYIIPDANRGGGRPGQQIMSHEIRSESFPAEVDAATTSALHVHFPEHEDQIFPIPSPNNLAPSRALSHTDTIPSASVLHYTDASLSTELQRVLNRSTLDPEASITCGLLGPSDSLLSLSQLNASTVRDSVHVNGDEEMTRDQKVQRQYMWLEKYHQEHQ